MGRTAWATSAAMFLEEQHFLYGGWSHSTQVTDTQLSPFLKL